MAPVNEIVNVQISRGSVNVSQVGFGTILIVGPNANFKERLAYCSDLSSVADALLTGTAAPEYKAAEAVFSQNPSVTRVAIGHRSADVAAVFTGGIGSGQINYVCNGVSGYVAYSGNTATTLGLLATALNAIDGITSAILSSSTITLIADAGTVIGLTIDIAGGNADTLAVTFSTSNEEDITDALNAIEEEQPDWYGLVLTSRNTTDVASAAAWTEAADMKVFVTASSDPNVIASSDTTSIAYEFKNLGYLKTQVRYAAKASTEYPDAALLGKILPYDPGSYSAAFKSLAGVSVDALTSTQRANAFGKNVDVYEYVGGVNVTRNGKVAGGEYLDVMIFIDWLKARCTEAVYQILVSNLKVPYTDAGIASVQNALTQPLKAGQNAGGISPTAFDDAKAQIGGFYITVPRLQDVPTVDKTNRTLNNVKFVAFLAGAIQIIQIRVTVTL